ncbi:MAG: EAL domain-containing protein [Gammaproteobacteria bacterium]|nr:EAL domain-containing protein [Gammaproteobacteria bacterium]
MTHFLGLDGRLHLKHRQMIAVVGVSITILVLATIAFFINDYVAGRASLQENIKSKAVFISANSSAALAFRDRRAGDEALRIASIDESVELAVLYDYQHKVFTTFLRPGLNIPVPEVLPAEGITFSGSAATIVEPVSFHGDEQGWIYLVYDISSLQEKVITYSKVALGIFMVGLLLSWLMAGISQKFIAEPIVQLAKLVEKITHTQNYSERMHVERSDELGVLIRGFNNMLSAIEEREAELQRHGERLESLVELRTQQLHHRANYDALTRLPNRYLLMEKLHQAIESARRTKRNMALLLIDLDRFKIINDSLGHHVGDELLQALARRLSGISRVDDSVGRLGGDEFVILLGNVTKPDDAELVAKKVMEELSEPFVLQHHRLHISASIGISVFPGDATDPVGLLRRADVSMYRSKQHGKSAYSFYDSAMDNSDKRLELESKLRNALSNEEIYMVYQPQVCIQTHTICGVEALMRWHNQDLGDIYPTEFIPVAVEIGLINELTMWAIADVCRQLNSWDAQNVRPVRIAVNVSAADLLMADFVAGVRNNIEKYKIDPSRLELEITEDVFLDHTDQIVDALRELKDLGVRIAIDDFGTGYSSLSYLRDFPADVLKLDGSFVERIHESEKSRGIVASAVSLAHGLGLQIVAECVETQTQYDYLISQNCDIIQGHFISAALMGDALAIFLNQHEELLIDNTAVAS